jgi:hypothetical protein
MTKRKSSPLERIGVPPRQEPIRSAQQKAVEALRGQTDAQLEWLGADRARDQWRMPVMDGVFLVDTNTGDVCRDDGEPVLPTWRILALHYLAVQLRPTAQPPQITFSGLPSARTYATVYEARVNRRLCAGVGRDTETLVSAAAEVGAQRVDGGDLAFELDVFPRIPLRLIWYAGDEELPPACTLLLPANIESFLCTEDIVVLSESFVSRLGGKSF